MAEDDLDFGDDDLDLGDDDLDLDDSGGDDLDLDDSGGDDLDLDDAGDDDFAGELDGMMGDDELGGESDSGGEGDSELDSFFEDLSSIEDMDEGGSDVEEAVEEAEEAPKKEEKKAKKAAPKKDASEKGKSSKLKFIIPILILLIAGGGGGSYWFMSQSDEEQVITEEEKPVLEVESLIKETEPVKLMKPKPVERIVVQPDVEPVKAVKRKLFSRKYLIQVATCSYDNCKEEYIRALREDGEPVFQKSSGEKYDFIELLSRQVYSYGDANRIVKRINSKNKMAGNASVYDQTNGYRISMGTFTALDRAKKLKFHVEKMFPKKSLSFSMEHKRRDYITTKVFAGPYVSRTVAKKVLRSLRMQKRYQGSFLIQVKEPL